MALESFKKKTVHRVVMEDDVVISDETYEVTDWDAYWIFDHDAQPTESVIGLRYFFDKDEYPRMEDAQNACKVEIYEQEKQRAAERERRAAEVRARNKAQREERAARKSATGK